MKTRFSKVILAALVGVAFTWQLQGQGTAFTYQGRFTEDGVDYTGNVEMNFSVWDAVSDGSPVSTNNVVVVDVTNGLFVATLDFGGDIFTGPGRWLQIEARISIGSFTPLVPRIPIHSTPYAMAAGHLTGTLPSAALSGSYDGPVSFNHPENVYRGDGSALSGIYSLDAVDGSPAEAVFVDASGRVGVGTAGPLDPLHVVGAIRSTHEVVVQNPNNAEASVRYSWLNDVARLRIGGLGAGAINGFDVQGVGDNSLLRILQNGHVGIGTVTPSSNLEIVDATDGDAAFSVLSPGSSTGGIYISSPGGVPGFIALANNTNRRDIRFTDQGIALWTSASAASPPLGNGLFVDQVGRVGIGTASPGAALHVTGSFLAGHPANSILAGKFGGVVAGGGTQTAPNEVRGNYASVLGGAGNLASGDHSFAMGTNATASALASTAVGRNVTASGSYSFAGGIDARALHEGAFVWACPDASNRVFSSDAEDVFYARSFGGVSFITATLFGLPVGAKLAPGSSSWEFTSDRHSKENMEPVDTQKLLEQLVRIPIHTWNWITQDDAIRHMGPMAQDFFEAFQLGQDDKHISTVDTDGVALAAIQGLNKKLEERLEQKESEIAKLEQRLEMLEGVVRTLTQSMTSRNESD